jgi:hypothetical protein
MAAPIAKLIKYPIPTESGLESNMGGSFGRKLALEECLILVFQLTVQNAWELI